MEYHAPLLSAEGFQFGLQPLRFAPQSRPVMLCIPLDPQLPALAKARIMAEMGKADRKPANGKPLNLSLHAAKATRQDEFYARLSDIEKELRHYTRHFKNKTILCNCDDPKVSNFFHCFSHNFEKLKLKKPITTSYKNCCADLFSTHKVQKGVYLEYDGDKNANRVPDSDEIGIHKLKGDGDFRGEECVNFADTNWHPKEFR